MQRLTADMQRNNLQYNIMGRGRPSFVFFLFFGARKRIFIFRRFIFRPKKTSAFSFYFLFFGTKMAVKNKKESQYFG